MGKNRDHTWGLLAILDIKLSAAERDSGTPPSLAALLASLGARAEAALHSVRHIASGIYPAVLADFGLVEALRGRHAHATVRLHHDHSTLVLRIEDDRDGFDPAHTPDGGGPSNIHDRISALHGTVELASRPGQGTVLTMALPWSPRLPTAAARVHQPRGPSAAWAK